MRYGHRAVRGKAALLCAAFLLVVGAAPSFAAPETEEEAESRAEREFFSAESGELFADERQKESATGGEPEAPPVYIPPDDALPKVTARSAVVMDALTGEVLYQRGMNDRRYPASTTKIMTLITAL